MFKREDTQAALATYDQLMLNREMELARLDELAAELKERGMVRASVRDAQERMHLAIIRLGKRRVEILVLS